MVVMQDGDLHGMHSPVSKMRNPLGLDPGVSSGDFRCGAEGGSHPQSIIPAPEATPTYFFLRF
jgi:hypothetical protein